jgi:hypothetical protein
MEISEGEHAVLNLAADYATGNRPQTPWERLARRRHVADTTAPAAADDEDRADGQGIDAVNEVAVLDPRHHSSGSEPDET